MSKLFSLPGALRLSLAAAAIASSAFTVAHAQATTPTSDALFSSSLAADAGETAATVAQTNLASLEKGINLPDMYAQYGRRRYGAPRYRGSNTNADGSEKYTVYAGGGFASPSGSDFNYASTSWGFEVGGGRNFNKRFGLNLEFDYDHFGMTGDTLNNQQNLYNYYIGVYNQTQVLANQAPLISGLDGNNHVFSLSVDPTFTFYQKEGLGAYVIGGAGFYHKVANFTTPQVGFGYDAFGDVYEYEANEVIDHYTSNAPGFNGGVGFTYKFSRFANEKLFGEVRYVYVVNSARPGVTVNELTPANIDIANDFPQNSQHTEYLPVKFGIRF